MLKLEKINQIIEKKIFIHFHFYILLLQKINNTKMLFHSRLFARLFYLYCQLFYFHFIMYLILTFQKKLHKYNQLINFILLFLKPIHIILIESIKELFPLMIFNFQVILQLIIFYYFDQPIQLIF